MTVIKIIGTLDMRRCRMRLDSKDGVTLDLTEASVVVKHTDQIVEGDMPVFCGVGLTVKGGYFAARWEGEAP